MDFENEISINSERKQIGLNLIYNLNPSKKKRFSVRAQRNIHKSFIITPKMTEQKVQQNIKSNETDSMKMSMESMSDEEIIQENLKEILEKKSKVSDN